METNIKCMLVIVAAIAVASTALGQKPAKPDVSSEVSAKRIREMEKHGMRPPSGPSFFIGPVEGSPLFSVLLSDGAGKSVSGSFNLHQIEILEAVVQAAKDFSLSEEAAGAKSPITTRLMDQHEWSFFVDVTKAGNKSTLYLSLISPSGRLTAPVGEITRGSKKEQSPLLFDILSRLKATTAGK